MIRSHVTDGVATLTLDRPEAQNAIGPEAGRAPAAHVARAAGERAVRALAVTGAGGPAGAARGGSARAPAGARGRLGRALADGPASARGRTKRGLPAAAERTLPELLAWEAAAQATGSKTRAAAEGVAAFREKRPPRFTGE